MLQVVLDTKAHTKGVTGVTRLNDVAGRWSVKLHRPASTRESAFTCMMPGDRQLLSEGNDLHGANAMST